MRERKKLTENFHQEEFDCPCCGFNIIQMEIVELLQKVRTAYGAPLIVTSGTRCTRHNKFACGSPTSDHLTGAAVDIVCYNALERRKLVSLALEAGIPTIGIKKDCLHFSIGLPARIFTYD